MDIENFNYDLPEKLIAQVPLKNRDSSRLLVMDRKSGDLKDEQFKNITSYLNKGDVLVLNDTKVLPARIFGKKTSTNGQVELLLLKNIEKDRWECLCRPARRIKVGTKIEFKENLEAEVLKKKDDGIVEVVFNYDGIFLEKLEKIGSMPLPPYIHASLEEKERYQTVYAKNIGSAAAPTAGLHFTKDLLKDLKEKGVEILYVTLHVGLGTFRPVSVNDITKHSMHFENFSINDETCKRLNLAKKEGRKIYAVGTTSTRVLESVYSKYNSFVVANEKTNIFIYPGYEFKAIDGLITNFHLPKSTLLMLVSAFSSKEYILNAYKYAIKNEYRFFSFGDAMFIK